MGLNSYNAFSSAASSEEEEATAPSQTPSSDSPAPIFSSCPGREPLAPTLTLFRKHGAPLLPSEEEDEDDVIINPLKIPPHRTFSFMTSPEERRFPSHCDTARRSVQSPNPVEIGSKKSPEKLRLPHPTDLVKRELARFQGTLFLHQCTCRFCNHLLSSLWYFYKQVISSSSTRDLKSAASKSNATTPNLSAIPSLLTARG